jgi:YVTN family beta-propeller protein
MKPLHTAVLIALTLTQSSAFAAKSEAQADYAVAQRFKLGELGGWDLLSVDSDKHRLFISRSDRVMVVDTKDGKLLGTIADTQGVHGIALAPSLGRGFTSNGRANTLTEFDLATLKTVRTLPAGGENPDVILYDEHSRHLFAFNGRSKDVSVIDPVSGKVLATIPAGGKPEFAASDGHGQIFVNIEDTAQIKRIDTKTNQVTATWKLADCEEPSGLALDVKHQRLFSTCQNGKMAVTDARDGKHVASVAIGKGPDGAGFDAERGLVFSSNGQDGTLTIVHEDTADSYRVLANVVTQKSARTLALDPGNHHIYTVAAEFGPTPAATTNQPRPRPPVLEGSFSVLEITPAIRTKP